MRQSSPAERTGSGWGCQLTERTTTDLDALLAVLDGVESQGFALVDQEPEQGVRSISVPLRGATGRWWQP